MNPSSNPKTDPLSQLPPQAGRRRIDTTCPPSPPEGGRPPDRHPQVADDPRIDTLRWRTNPRSTTLAASPGKPPRPIPCQGGRPPDRHPQVADEPPIDHPGCQPRRTTPPHSLPRRTKPGSTPSGGGRPPDRPPWQPAHANHPPCQGGRNPDPPPQVADEPRIDTLRWRTTPGSTTMAASPGEPPRPIPCQGGRTPGS